MFEKLKTVLFRNKILILAAVLMIVIGGSCMVVSAVSGRTSSEEAETSKPAATEAAMTPKPSQKKASKTTSPAATEVVSEEAVTTKEATPAATETVTEPKPETDKKTSDQTKPQTEPAAKEPAPAVQEKQTPANPSGINMNMEFPYLIKVNKQQNCVTIYGADESGNYTIPCKAMVCSAGHATPLGSFNTLARYNWKVLKGNVWGQYSTRIVGGILFHSVPYKSNAKNTLKADYYNKLGTTASAGCIRLTTIDAKWIYDNCPIGTTVIIYNDANPGPLGKPSATKITAETNNGWDPTDPDPANPWYVKGLTLDCIPLHTVERGGSLDLMAGVSASDRYANDITGSVQVSGAVDFSKTGQYTIHYEVTDSLGNTAGNNSVVTVIDTTAPVITDLGGDAWKKTSEITRDYLASLVSVSDNGYPIDAHTIEISIPSWHDGDNQITYTARDESNHSVSLTKTIHCDGTAPTIALNQNAEPIMPENQALTDEYLLSRVSVNDISPVETSVSYHIDGNVITAVYTAADAAGNRSECSEQFHFNSYAMTVPGTIYIDSIENQNELLSYVTLKDSFGNTLSASNGMVSASWEWESENRYHVTYTCQYDSPAGKQTVTTQTIAVIN